MAIEYRDGDVRLPARTGTCIVAHVCNDQGGWGAGVALAIGHKWPQARLAYVNWRARALGASQLVQVGEFIYVANMVAQRGFRSAENDRPFDDQAAFECLIWLTNEAQSLSASVHMPRIGCGLGGAQWHEVQPLIEQTLVESAIDTVIYTLL